MTFRFYEIIFWTRELVSYALPFEYIVFLSMQLALFIQLESMFSFIFTK